MKYIKELLKFIREEYILLTAFGPIQRKWLRFLKNNPDKQYKNKLGYNDGKSPKTCCLGQFGLMVNICTWVPDGFLHSIEAKDNFPDRENMIKYGFRTHRGDLKSLEDDKSLAGINDNGTWLDVYNACLNDPKGYFTKKV